MSLVFEVVGSRGIPSVPPFPRSLQTPHSLFLLGNLGSFCRPHRTILISRGTDVRTDTLVSMDMKNEISEHRQVDESLVH